MRKFDVSLTMKVAAEDPESAIQLAAQIVDDGIGKPFGLNFTATETHLPYCLMVQALDHDNTEAPELCVAELTLEQVGIIDQTLAYLRSVPGQYKVQSLNMRFESKWLILPDVDEMDPYLEELWESVQDNPHVLLPATPGVLRDFEERKNLSCHELEVWPDGCIHFQVSEDHCPDQYQTEAVDWDAISQQIAH